jgi:epoxyqueuosine reductase
LTGSFSVRGKIILEYSSDPHNFQEPMMKSIDEIVRRHLVPSDEFIYGYSDLRGLLDRKFQGYNFGISIGRRLDREIVDKVITGPTTEYYSHYKQVNNDLAQLTKAISGELNQYDIETSDIDPTVSTAELDSIYFNTLRTDLSHKMVATRAGLGWIGKTDLFVSKIFGPRVRLVSILLKTQVKSVSDPVNISHCGNCNICVDSCPAKAANGKLWDITVEREEFFDPWKCRDQCAEFGRMRFGTNARICGICVAVCPIGRKDPNIRKPDLF